MSSVTSSAAFVNLPGASTPLAAPGGSEPAVEFQYELSPDLVTTSDARVAEAEAIRTIRTHIMARHLGGGKRGLAVCAAKSNVGCSFVAANLAVALSQAGTATLLIDGDMRRPEVQDFIRPSQPSAGLKQCLASPGVHAGDFIHHDVLPHLSIMYSGGVAENAQELLASDAFKTLVDQCLRDFEFTIIDTPAADSVADALGISSTIGYTLIVAKAHVSRSIDLTALAKQLHEDGAVVIGTVLNEI